MSISTVMEVIQQVRQQLNDYPMSDYLYNEATTRNVVINPMIKALGWDLHNLDQCSYEINPKINPKAELSGKMPADYVLGPPRRFLRLWPIEGIQRTAGAPWNAPNSPDGHFGRRRPTNHGNGRTSG